MTGYDVVLPGKYLRTFRRKLLILTSGLTLKMEECRLSKTSVLTRLHDVSCQ